MLANLARQVNAKKINISAINNSVKSLPFSELMPFIYDILDQELYFEVWLKNFPYCVVSPNARDHILFDKSYKGEKLEKCKGCRWGNFCVGFPVGYFKKFSLKELSPILDLPEEVMIELESKCNFDCKFCFNKASFAVKSRNIINLETDYIKKVIEGIAISGIKIVRFTGGEPLLRSDIFQLAEYAKQKNLEVRLNTNGSLINKEMAEKIRGVFDNILVPIESYTDKKEEEITMHKCSLKKKIEAFKFLEKINIPMLRVGTVATGDNIINFDKIARFVLKLPIKEWELYRPVALDKKKIGLDSNLLDMLADKIIEYRAKTKIEIILANALPFCAIKNKNKINSISAGGVYDDGNRRLVVDPRGFVKPHYFINKNIGDPLHILKAWNHPFMKKMRNLEFLPKICKNCDFKYKCCGGSRYSAKMNYKQWNLQDPIIK